jgi:hypothetical protein
MANTAFRCPGFVGLFEWVVMTFGLKNAGATYQRAMNLIFHDLLGMLMEVYIDNLVIKLACFEGHLADLRIVFERMRKYNMKVNMLKCAFRVSVGRFLGFVVHKKSIEVDPKKVVNQPCAGSPMQARCVVITRKDKIFVKIHCKYGWQGGIFLATNPVEARGWIRMG